VCVPKADQTAEIAINNEVRIDELEARLAQQDHSIEELSDEVYQQQKHIAQLDAKVRQLVERLEVVAPPRTSSDPAAEVPPHY
jgi:SlyX protein